MHVEQTAPVWAVFGDLMAGLLGAFVLILVGVLVVQIDLVAASSRRWKSARGRAAPHGARKGVWPFRWPAVASRSTMAASASAAVCCLPPAPTSCVPMAASCSKAWCSRLQVYLRERDEMLMVSGFTDNTTLLRDAATSVCRQPGAVGPAGAHRGTRALIDEGMPSSQVFAAAFGAEQPVADNAGRKRAARRTAAWKWPRCPRPHRKNHRRRAPPSPS
jgi:hypothetical protein